MNSWWVHAVDVETAAGLGANGQAFNAAVSVDCFVIEQTRMVLDREGIEVVSSTTIYTPLDKAPLFKPLSRVTYDGSTAVVISNKSHRAGGLDLPECTEIALA